LTLWEFGFFNSVMHGRLTTFLIVFMALSGCKSWKAPVPVDQVDFMDRARTEEHKGLRVTVGVPDRNQTKQIFGTSLYDSRIQPVWVEVENRTTNEYSLIKSGMDRNYYSPLEVAWKRKAGGKKTKAAMREFFFFMDFPNPVLPGETASGFIFTDLDEGFKGVLVDLLSDHDVVSMSFVVEVPGLVTDLKQREFKELYRDIVDIQSEDELRMILASLPAATTDKKGENFGDPLNIAFVGDPQNIFSALIRSDWHVTEVTYAASNWKTVKSFLFGARYLYSPISPLYVFGRSQDLGLQRARHSINTRNHMRLWMMPYRYEGYPVWLGQISRDIGVKMSKRTIVTHAIDPDVDETRNGLVGDLAYSQALGAVAFVKGSQRSDAEDLHYNLSPDVYYSDGLRAVLFFKERPHALDEIRLLDWEEPNRTKERMKALQDFKARTE